MLVSVQLPIAAIFTVLAVNGRASPKRSPTALYRDISRPDHGYSYGPPDVVRITDVAKPVPGEGEVLIAVRAAAVNPLDGLTTGKPYSLRVMTGLRKPKVTRLGVDTREDFTTDDRRYDIVFDCIGNHALSACRRVLNREGVYLGVGGPSSRWLLGLAARPIAMLLLSRFVSQELTVFIAKPRREDLIYIRDLMAAGKITPVIDRSYSLAEVAEAMRYQQTRHARGKVVISLGDTSPGLTA